MSDQKHKKNSQQKNQDEDYKEKYLRALADYHNLEKRIEESRKVLSDNARRDLIVKLLPFLDNLEKAQVFVKDKGLALIKDELFGTLAKEGLEEIHLKGEEFDPYFAEAVDAVPGDEDNKIVEVLQKGYTLHGKVIRPAQVKVSKKQTS